MHGLNDKGFKRKTYDEILTEMIEMSREKFGNNINVSSRSLYGMFIRIISWIVAGLWELAEKVYLSGYARYATGITLDRIANNIGLFRRGLQSSYGEITLYKDIEEAIEIPAGFIVRGVNNEDYITNETYIFPADAESLTVLVQSVEKGEKTNLDKLGIKEIVTPIDGIYKAQNLNAIIGGADTETDNEFRERYFSSLSFTGSATRSALEGKLRSLDGVQDVVVLENDTEQPLNGLPPHFIKCIVLGGNPRDIGYTILSNKAAGIGTQGEEKLEIKDDQGQLYTVYYEKPKELNYDVLLEVYKGDTTTVITARDIEKIEETAAKYLNSLTIGKGINNLEFMQQLDPSLNISNIIFKDKATNSPILAPGVNETIRAESVTVEVI